jgi:hypothetical protein
MLVLEMKLDILKTKLIIQEYRLLKEQIHKESILKTERNLQEHTLRKELNHKEIILKTKLIIQEYRLLKEQNHKEIILNTERNLQEHTLRKEPNHKEKILNLEIHHLLTRKTIQGATIEGHNTLKETILKHGSMSRVFFYRINQKYI